VPEDMKAWNLMKEKNQGYKHRRLKGFVPEKKTWK
jgi:hypothetical protein